MKKEGARAVIFRMDKFNEIEISSATSGVFKGGGIGPWPPFGKKQIFSS